MYTNYYIYNILLNNRHNIHNKYNQYDIICRPTIMFLYRHIDCICNKCKIYKRIFYVDISIRDKKEIYKKILEKRITTKYI